MSVIDELKTDWTPADFYNFEDLNRVEEATELVKDQIVTFRGIVISLECIYNRTEKSIEFANSLNRIENNILLLTQQFPNTVEFEEIKTDWTFNKPFDFTDANRLEKNLQIMYEYVVSNQANVPYCGQYITGQEGVL